MIIDNTLEFVDGKFYSWQRDIIDSIKKSYFNKGNRSIHFSLGTGLGKSYIMYGVIDEILPRGSRILYINRQTATFKSLQRKDIHKELVAKGYKFDSAANHSFMTSKYWDDQWKEYVCKTYDAIMIDESHHLNSDIEGLNIIDLIRTFRSMGKLALAFTAIPNPIGVNKSMKIPEYFEDHIAGMTLDDAILAGIVPAPVVIKFASEYIDANETDINRATKGKARKRITFRGCYKQLKEHFDKNPDTITHILAYFSQYNDLNVNLREFKELFGDEFKIFIVSNQKSDYANAVTVEEFGQCEDRCILFSVGKIVEGIHPDKADCVIFFRNTNSNVLLTQVFGRIIHIGATYPSTFFDIYSSTDKSIKTREEGRQRHLEYGLLNEKSVRIVEDYTVTESTVLTESETIDMIKDRYKNIHRGIRYRNMRHLARILHVPYAELMEEWKSDKYDNITILIDHYLKKFEKTILGYTFSTNADLAEQLHISAKEINICRKVLSMNYEQIINKFKDGGKLVNTRLDRELDEIELSSGYIE